MNIHFEVRAKLECNSGDGRVIQFQQDTDKTTLITVRNETGNTVDLVVNTANLQRIIKMMVQGAEVMKEEYPR